MMQEQRYKELDALRGIAVALMILYHILFDMYYFYGLGFPVLDYEWRIFAKGIATLFLLLLGICFMISWHRSAKDSFPYAKYFERGMIILGGGILISFFTWFIAPEAYVKFGILHLIGVSVLLQPFFARFGIWNIAFGIICTMIGIHFARMDTQSFLLFPFGIIYDSFASLDYYPLFPWFGTVLTGMGLGSIFYVPERYAALKKLDALPYPNLLLGMGKYALILYFLHQPLILLALALTLGMPTR
jgi:uncharacterized membrane protein